MPTTTISKKITRGEELIVIPRKEYETLLGLKKIIEEFKPTTAQKKDLLRAGKNRKKGNFLTINELRHKLGFTN